MPAGSGAFTIAMPAGPAAGGYDLHLIARGRYGSDERSMHLSAYVPAPTVARERPSTVKIAHLALAADTVVAGTPIVISYRTPAETGFVRLIDEYGTVRAEALLSRSGTSLLAAPLVDADQDLRVVVTAERGTARDEAQIPVRVLRSTLPPNAADLANGNVAAPQVPAIAPGVGPDGAPLPQTQTQTQSIGAAGAPLLPASVTGATRQAEIVPNGPPIAVTRAQSATAPIVVHVLRYEPKMHVAVLGNSGEELEGADVGPRRLRRLAFVAEATRDAAPLHRRNVRTRVRARDDRGARSPFTVLASRAVKRVVASLALFVACSAPVATLGDTTITHVGNVEVIQTQPDATPNPHLVARRTVRAPVLGASTSLRGAGDLIRTALSLVGTRYVWGGANLGGFDCSGFTYYAFARLGIQIPRTADAQFALGRPVVGDPLPGDLVFFQTYDYGASHVGIYLGGRPIRECDRHERAHRELRFELFSSALPRRAPLPTDVASSRHAASFDSWPRYG